METASILDDFLRSFRSLASMKLRNYEAILSMDWSPPLPRRTKMLGTLFMKDIGKHTDPLILAIGGCLYLEYLVIRRLQKGCCSLRSIDRMTLSQRLDILKEADWLDLNTIERIRDIGRLRNCYAHELVYDILDWEPRMVDWVRDANIRTPAVKKYKRQQNIILLRLVLTALNFDISEQWSWLSLEDVAPCTGLILKAQ